MSERGSEEEGSYKDVENPLHREGESTNDFSAPVKTGKALLDGPTKSDETTGKKKEKTTDLTGYYAVVLMFIVGCFSGILVNVVQWAMSMLSLMQAKLIVSNPAGPFCFMLTSATMCGLAAFICKKSGRVAVLGSGIPEVKALLTNEFHPTELATVVSSRIGFTRMISIVLSLGSGLSVGNAAPLVHMTVCNAYTIMKLSPDFGCLLENSAMMRQIFNASAAAGMAACFSCPLGGVLFSIEVTSSHYMMANYWRSFMAATAGAVLFAMILWWRGINDIRTYPLDYIEKPYSHWEFPLFFILGMVCGLLSYVYLKCQQAWFLFIRKVNVTYPIAVASTVGGFTALMIFAVGSYTAKGVTCGAIVGDLLKSGYTSELQRFGADPIGGLFATLLIRWILTIVGTTVRIPAGFFTPMVMIGAIIGRIFGHIVQIWVGADVNIYISGYALVGACAFASGTTHTVSAAVVMLESTGQFTMFLPCLIGAIVGSGVVKGYTVSLYNQGLINKGLESFEQLLLESGDFSCARDMMDPKADFVTRNCQVGDLLGLMENRKLGTFAVIDSTESCKLIGSISRRDVYQFLKQFYARHGLVAFVRQMMPEDTKQDDYRLARKRKMEARTQWLRAAMVKSEELEDEVAFKAAAANGGMAGLINTLTGSTHGNSAAAGGSSAQHAALAHHASSSSTAGSQTHPEGGMRAYDAYDEEEQEDQDGLESDEEDGLGAQEDEDTGASPNRSGGFNRASQLEAGRGNWEQRVSVDTQRSGDSAVDASARTSASSALGGPRTSSVVEKVTSVLNAKQRMRANLAYLDKDQEARAQLLLKHRVDITAERLLPLNLDPYTVHSTSSVDQVYTLFNSVKANVVFVVEGELVLQGVISQAHLMTRLKKKY